MTQTSGSAWSGGSSPAMLLAYMRCTVAAMPALLQQVGPQGGEGQVRGAGQSFHRRLWHDSAPAHLHTAENAMTTSTTTSPTIRIEKAGGPEEMKLVELPVGEPGPGEVRIRHHACGLNFIDVYQRSGVYTLPMPLTLGNEGAGVDRGGRRRASRT